MIIKLCGITRAKVLEISDTMGYGYTLEHVEEAGDNLYNMQLPDTTVIVKNTCLHLCRLTTDMYINEDEFYKLEVL